MLISFQKPSEESQYDIGGERKLFGVAVEGRTHFQQAWKCGQKGRFLVRPLVSEEELFICSSSWVSTSIEE